MTGPTLQPIRGATETLMLVTGVARRQELGTRAKLP